MDDLGPCKCVVKGCSNHRDEGKFVGEFCSPCYTMLTTGKVTPSPAWFVEEITNAKEEVLKDVTITSKTSGEVVAVTLTDEDYKVYKVLWTKEKK